MRRLPVALPESDAPTYQRMALVLADAITTGVFGQGGRLPRVNALANRYGISPDTVRGAMGRLVADGVARKGPGGRVYVRRPLRPSLEAAGDEQGHDQGDPGQGEHGARRGEEQRGTGGASLA